MSHELSLRQKAIRTIERVLQQGGRTSPAFRPGPCACSGSYPTIRLTHSNQRHQLDLIGPRYLKGSRREWYFLVYRDVHDGAVFVEFQPKPRMEGVLAFLVRVWQHLGLPDTLQVDNSDLTGTSSFPAREFYVFGPSKERANHGHVIAHRCLYKSFYR